MERFVMFWIHLEDGTWSTALDILHDKLAARCMQGQCEVTFYELGGEEISVGEGSEIHSTGWDIQELWYVRWDIDTTELLID
jgi:hypothetical protein